MFKTDRLHVFVHNFLNPYNEDARSQPCEEFPSMTAFFCGAAVLISCFYPALTSGGVLVLLILVFQISLIPPGEGERKQKLYCNQPLSSARGLFNWIRDYWDLGVSYCLDSGTSIGMTKYSFS